MDKFWYLSTTLIDEVGNEYEISEISDDNKLIKIKLKTPSLKNMILEEEEAKLELYESESFKRDAIRSGMTEETIEDLINCQRDHYNYLLNNL